MLLSVAPSFVQTLRHHVNISLSRPRMYLALITSCESNRSYEYIGTTRLILFFAREVFPAPKCLVAKSLVRTLPSLDNVLCICKMINQFSLNSSTSIG